VVVGRFVILGWDTTEETEDTEWFKKKLCVLGLLFGYFPGRNALWKFRQRGIFSVVDDGSGASTFSQSQISILVTREPTCTLNGTSE